MGEGHKLPLLFRWQLVGSFLANFQNDHRTLLERSQQTLSLSIGNQFDVHFVQHNVTKKIFPLFKRFYLE